MLSHFSHVQFFAEPMDCSPAGFSVHGISKQEYWNEFLCTPLRDLPNSGTEHLYLTSPELAGWFFTAVMLPEKPIIRTTLLLN